MLNFFAGLLVGWAIRKKSAEMWKMREKTDVYVADEDYMQECRNWDVWEQIMRVTV